MELVLLFIITAHLEVLYPMVKKKVNRMSHFYAKAVFFSATKSIAKLFHHRACPRIANNSWVLAVVVDLRSYAAVGNFCSLCQSRHAHTHVLAIKFVKDATKQMCQRMAQQGRWVTQSVQTLTGGMAGWDFFFFFFRHCRLGVAARNTFTRVGSLFT